MNREETLERHKDLIITIATKDLRLPENDIIKEKWIKSKDLVVASIAQLSQEDRSWMEVEYRKWFNTDKLMQEEMLKRQSVIEEYSGLI